MLNFGASKPRVKGGPRPPGPPLDPYLKFPIDSELAMIIHLLIDCEKVAILWKASQKWMDYYLNKKHSVKQY